MGISVEPQIFTIRGGAEHEKFGDDYSFVVTGVKSGEHAVRLIGMVIRNESDKFTWADYKSLVKYFLSIGITKAEWERIGDDTVRKVEKEL